MKVNGKDDNPYIMENKTCSKPPKQIWILYCLYCVGDLRQESLELEISVFSIWGSLRQALFQDD